MKEDKIFSLLIGLAAGVVVYVILIGGLVCIRDNKYTFNEYLTDVAQVAPYLFGAIIAVVIKGVRSDPKPKRRDERQPFDRRTD